MNTKNLKTSVLLSAVLLCVSQVSSFASLPSMNLEEINSYFLNPKTTEEVPVTSKVNIPQSLSSDPFTPIPNEDSDFNFNPPNIEQITVSEPQPEVITQIEQPPVVVQEVLPSEIDNNTYTAHEEAPSPIDMEGKLISNILIAGLDKVDQEVVLSRLKTQKGSKYNAELLQQDLQNVYDTGYFKDDMVFEPTLDSDGTVDLVLNVKENILVSKVSVMGNTVISSNELIPILSPLKNLPQNIRKVNETIDAVNQYYYDKGYILARVSDVSDNNDGELIFYINEGIINKISIEGNERTKDFIIERNIMTQPGTVYNENLLKQDISRIYSTQIFKEVDRRIDPCDGEHGQFDVTVLITENESNSVSIGAGIDSALGVFGSVGYKDDNFLGRGQKLSLNGMVGSGILLSDESIKNRMNYQVELNFFEPYFLNADNSLMGKLYYRDLGSYSIPLAIERRIGGRIGVDHKISGYDNLSANLTLGLEGISLKEGDYDKISSLYAARGIDIKRRAHELSDGFFFNIEPGLKYSTLDSEEIPREGVIANARFMESLCLTNTHHTSGRLAGGVTKYYPVRQKSSFSLTARGGVKVHGDQMPEIYAFRLGGPYSVRGFKMNGVGMGEGFLMGSAELATPLPFVDRLKYDFLKKIRFTMFVDAGRVFDETTGSVLFDRPLSAISAGVGLKVYIPGVGPMSIDYGIPFTNTGHYSSKHGYFTFGSGYYGSY